VAGSEDTRLRVWWRLARGIAGRWRAPPGTEAVHAYCMFVGFPRSGHSLLGEALNAHPDCVIANELNALWYLRTGGRAVNANALWRMILDRERTFAADRRGGGGYEYTFPGGWQGQVRTLRVIGDKKGGTSALWLRRDPGLLDRLREVVGVPLRVVVVTRHPLDNIATLAARQHQDPDVAIGVYERRAEGVAVTLERLAPGEAHVVGYEDVVTDPAAHLGALARFLGVAEEPAWVEAVRARLFASPSRTRDRVTWTEPQRERVAGLCRRFGFLAPYTAEV
jgi:hypothetical protein